MYVSASHLVLGSYILGLSIRSVILIFVVAALMGLIAFWLLTKKLNTITNGIMQFRLGRYDTRIPVKDNNELDKIGFVFNEMADTIKQNIKELKGVGDLRKELISSISNDLRTPVVSIQGYAETLLLKKIRLQKLNNSATLTLWKVMSDLKSWLPSWFRLILIPV